MNEPSVLDYVKSKLKFWQREKISLPDVEFAMQEEKPQSEPSSSQSSTLKPATFQPKNWLWRSLLALLLAIMGQAAFEPPHNTHWTGLVLYFAAFTMLALAYYRKEWSLPPLREGEIHPDNWRFKRIAFFLAIPFALAAFFTFAGNSFKFLNSLPWLLSLLLFVWSFWQSDASLKKTIACIKTFFQQREWSISISRWTLLIFVITAIVIFFRLYQIGAVPPEPFSDHAEKLLDVYDITQGETRIFFPRNTGREGFQMYWTLLVSKVFGTGLSFLSLKLGTALLGLLTLPFMYLLGKEIANRRVGLLAMFFMGIAYWQNVISRVGLRFPLYPLFVAPTLYYLLRGIRRQNRNDFILAGIFLGLGAHGYTPFRIMPFVVVAAVGLYVLHKGSKGARKQVIEQLIILTLFSLVVFLPLGRYALANPDSFSYRTLSRLGSPGQTFPALWWEIFASNVWDGMKMFNWDNGNIWVHSVANRPALGVVSGALFLIGVALLLVRYAKKRDWLDLFLLLSILLLQLPSTLSLVFPEENPALNRAGGAAVPVFVIVALALDGLLASLRSRASRRTGAVYVWGVTGVLLVLSIAQNYNLVFDTYNERYRLGAWNSSEMGQAIQQFEHLYGTTETVWIVPYEHWVDTRLPGVWAGIPNRDFAVWQRDLPKTLEESGPKMFIVKPEDEESLEILAQLYPQGRASRHESDVAGHDFMIFSVP